MAEDTQTDRRQELPANAGRLSGIFQSLWFLALIVTLANAAKPVVIDDTAYITYARHISANPLDPYGFEMFWWTVPEPAMTVLVPPVVPYWLAINIRLFGEYPALLKLWQFPFVWLFAWSVRDLLRRFARGTESRLLPIIVLSPAILPTVNLMLDVPALALGLASVAMFARAGERGSWRLTVVAGVLAALAMQTKYTALLIPPAILWYGITHRRVGLALVAVGVAVAAFAGWETLLVAKYGQSHFVYHVSGQKPLPDPGESAFGAFVREKAELWPPLVGHLGCLAIGVSLVAAATLGVPRRTLLAFAVLWAAGFLCIVFLPHRVTANAVPKFWQTFGTLSLVALALCACVLLRRTGNGPRQLWNADTLFVVGWVLLEVAGYFILTPFGAARRVIGLTVIGGLLVARTLGRVERIRPHRRPPEWVASFAIAAGVAVTAIDTLDAWPEKVCAESAAVVAADRPAGSTVWSVGHWGFQFYCERAGMKLLVPGETVLRPGDRLVLPIYPADGFFRPHAGSVPIKPPVWAVEPISEVVCDDAIAGQTIPNFYGGVDPVAGRAYPRLRVVVYRVTSAWAVPGK
ncbi:MAG: hypothetical protein C0467_13355 [Planctomycetaceae bacterium]|nr:hypothetical protein [Planctomycetaceae bacterium]